VKAYAYIDGLNLYNGALKGRPERKWLDVRKVCEELLPSKYQLSWIRYFTARVAGSATDPHQPQRQDLYLRALRGECTPFSLHEGRFRTDVSALPRAGSPSAELVKVRVTQEKGSDVNLAVHLIDDAAESAIDAAIVITDDFDQVGALTMAREHYGIALIVVSPRCHRGLSRTVGAEFYKPIHEQFLLECQLPEIAIDHEGREVHRPPAWIVEAENGEAAPRGGLLPSSRSS
jgi:NYN domain-containing protein